MIGMWNASQWMSRRKSCDIFQRHEVYLPVNLNRHWPLCVLMNPSKAREFATANVKDDSCEIPIMLHFDSLHHHNSSVVGNNVRRFLNFNWKQFHKRDNFIFSQTNYPIICPVGKILHVVLLYLISFLCLMVIISLLYNFFAIRSNSNKWIWLWVVCLQVHHGDSPSYSR